MIAEHEAANAINYLYAAQAINVTDGQAAVWADYLNAEIPGILPQDLLPAARQALKQWGNNRKTWKIDLPTFAHAVRAVRRQRVDEYTREHGPLEPASDLDGADYVLWLRTAHQEIQDGNTNPRSVEASAYQAIEQPNPSAPQVGARKDTK